MEYEQNELTDVITHISHPAHLLWCKECGRAVDRFVIDAETDINGCRDTVWFTSSKRERECDIAPVVARGVLIKRQIGVLEMNRCTRRRAVYRL